MRFGAIQNQDSLFSLVIFISYMFSFIHTDIFLSISLFFIRFHLSGMAYFVFNCFSYSYIKVMERRDANI